MKYLSIIRYVLTLVSVVVVVYSFIVAPADLTQMNVTMMLNMTYAFLGLSVAAVILLPLFVIAKNPKSIVRTLMGLIIVAIVVSISYSLSSSEVVQAATKVYDDPTVLKLSDTGLFTTYIAFGLAIVTIVVTEVINVFK